MASEFAKEQGSAPSEYAYASPCKQSEGVYADDLIVDESDTEHSGSIYSPVNSTPIVPVQGKIVAEEESTDVEIGNFFLEDGPSADVPPPEILELQKKERMREMSSEKNLEKLDGIWKKVVYVMILLDLGPNVQDF